VLPLCQGPGQAEAGDRAGDAPRTAGALVAAGALSGRVQPLLTAMEIACADCGCVVDRGVIVRRCDGHPRCCCGELPERSEES